MKRVAPSVGRGNPYAVDWVTVPKIRIIRSPRRKKSVQGRLKGDVFEVRVPARMTEKAAQAIAQELLEKVQAKSAPVVDLEEAARRLNRTVLQGKAEWTSISWVTNQNSRWGSCTPARGTIRISHRLQKVPQYVLDSVIVHELVHTFVPNHGPDFYAWANKVPHAERAQGYLEAYGRWGGNGGGAGEEEDNDGSDED
ncbi:hypothetical protein SAMN05660745_01450 [Corynebacterium glucuronolyticum]|nr:SprT-like family protein [Corynebacterium glucuronolyticum DSM 44120]SMB85474.1 hypothetical protein SAMN05660745_01450 [Corynebacterium glucuronolyticum]